MKCPICSIELQSIERKGFEYDRCPKCHGIWLDRSELVNIVEKAEIERVRTSLQMNSQRTVLDGETNRVQRKVKSQGFLRELFNFP